jgi:hypothetical protein
MDRRKGTPVGKLVECTVCKILNEEEIRSHKMLHYLERRDPHFKKKMAEVLCIYREVKIIKKTAAARQQPSKSPAPPTSPRRRELGSPIRPLAASNFTFTPKCGSGLSLVEGLFFPILPAPSSGTSAAPPNRNSRIASWLP